MLLKSYKECWYFALPATHLVWFRLQAGIWFLCSDFKASAMLFGSVLGVLVGGQDRIWQVVCEFNSPKFLV